MPPTVKKLNILVVEDNSVDAYIFKMNLNRSNIKKFNLLTSNTGRRGLDIIKAQGNDSPVDLIFLDYRLPDMDGISFLKEVHKLENAPPVIMLSGQGSEDVAVTALKDGAHNYITKDKLTPENLERVITSTLREFQEKKKIERDHIEAKKLAIHDPLTGLYNRRQFTSILANEFKKARRFHLNLSLIFLDIDHFKKINDTMGHDYGDKALKHFAHTLENTVRDIDIVCRYGGEEFIILLPNTDEGSAINLSLRIKEAQFANPLKTEERTLAIPCSQGISHIFDHSIRTAEDMVKKADAAMYAAKSNGRDSICTSKTCIGEHPTFFDSSKALSFKKEIERQRSNIKIYYRDLLFNIFESLTKENPGLKRHNLNVLKMTERILKFFPMGEDSRKVICNAALLHDIALIGIYTQRNFQEIVTKNSFAITQLTIEFLNSLKILDSEIPVLLHLHENFDGSGFPYNLKGESIPLGSRIIAAVDFFEALVTPQFKSLPSCSAEEALIQINGKSGIAFDPAVVACVNKVGRKPGS